MKKLSTLLLAFVLVLTSCSEDNDDTVDIATGILGTWQGKAVSFSGTSTTTIEGVSIDAYYEGEGYDIDFTLNFTENPNEVTAEGSYGIALTVTIFEQSETQNIPDNAFGGVTSTWTQDGNEITISTEEGESITYEILELTADRLVMVTDNIQDITGELDDNIANAEMRIELER